MKYTKSKIGMISMVETESLRYKEAIKKIPKEARIMKSWEYLKLVEEDFKSLKRFPKDWYFLYGTKNYYRACRLNNFDYDSFVSAYVRNVDNPYYSLRGVFVVKKKK